MRGSSFVNVLFLLSSSLLLTTTLQQPTHGAKKPYIVYLGGHSHGRNPSSADMQTATDSHYDLLASVLGSHEKAKEAIFYSYNKHINGFAALLAEEEAAEIKKNENVVSVFLSKVHSLQTTRSWEFLGLEGHDVHGVLGGGNTQNSAWRKTRFGENIIIANIDTGVWPEHPSFTDGGYGPIPPKWRGICQVNKLPTSNQTLCNRKLIGARIFHQGYEAQIGKISPDHHNNARDLVGHGTHTLAIAGGNFVRNASFIGNANGTAKGGSPRARVVAYKTCWDPLDENGCVESDIISAFDNAINDGVHVISISLNGHQRYPEDLLTDGISIGAFHAVSKGIVVVCSAGNEGPEAGTVKNVAPWSFTIAASSIDRKITNNITLGNGQLIEGASLATGFPSQSFPLIRSVDARLPNVAIQDALLCKPGTLDPNKVRGKIVICNRGHVMRPVQKGAEASRAGAVGLFMEQDKLSGNTLTSDPFVIGGSNYNESARTGGASYYDHTDTPVASMTNAKTFLGTTPAPIVASYSSRGPNVIQPAILKPDVTAPGVDILSAYTLAASPTNQQTDPRRILYNVLTGTSMATPHVAGIAGLVKKRHPNWSPAAIKSAIMTTATTRDNRNGPILDGVDDGVATPFAFGSGHVRPNLAIDPGLVYDIKISDYLKFLCASGYNERLVSSFYRLKKFECPKFSRVEDLNYPSITLPYVDTNLVNVTRILTNVGSPGTYILSVKPPKGVKVVIVPKTLTFGKVLEKKAFRVFLQATKLAQNSRPAFGEFSWSDGKHVVRSPIVIANVEK